MSGSRCLRTRATFWAVASLALLSLAVTVGAHAAGSAGFEAAYRAFAQAAGGDDGSIDAAASAFASLHAASPTNPVVTAYAGASTTLRARQARAPFDKMARAEDGLAQIDKALAMLTACARRADPARHAWHARSEIHRSQHLISRYPRLHEPRGVRGSEAA